jgi:hypothetical protein
MDSKVIVTPRPHPLLDRFRRWIVIVDGQQAAHLKNGQTAEIPLPHGRHELQLRIDWTGSKACTFQ